MFALKSQLLTVVAFAVFAGSAVAADKPPAVGDEAKDFELASLAGDKVKLSKLTADGPVVLVVLRGFPGYQCPICSKQFGELVGKADAFKEAKVEVVFIYPGPSANLQERAGEFVKGKDYPNHFRILLDPDYKFTNVYNLRWDAKDETAYPATFVIDRERKVKFAKVSKTHADRTKATDVLESLKK